MFDMLLFKVKWRLHGFNSYANELLYLTIIRLLKMRCTRIIWLNVLFNNQKSCLNRFS